MLTLLCTLCTGIWAKEVTDLLTITFTGISGTNYESWTGKKGDSGAVYAGRSGGKNSSIQLNSTSPSGVVSLKSGGKVKSLTVNWNNNTSNGRKLDIYGKNTAYDGSVDLYNSSNQGTHLGSLTYDGTSSQTLTITGDYTFIGFRSNDGAVYLTSVEIIWSDDTGSEDPNPSGTTLLYEGFSGYTSAGENTSEINTDYDNLDYKKWSSFSKVYVSGTNTAYDNGGCGKLGSKDAVGSMQANDIKLKGSGTLTFFVKKYGSDTGTLNVTIEGATVTGTTTITPTADWTQYTFELTGATGNVSITFATSSKRAYIDEIKLVEGVRLPMPNIAPNGGQFIGSQAVTISAEEGSIYYTTDGSTPTAENTLYSEPFTITETTIVKAIAMKDGITSNVTTAAFIKAEAPVTSFDPETGGYMKVGDKILVKFTGNVSKLNYSINDEDFTEVEVTNFYPIYITEEMVVNNQVKIKAYHTYTVGENDLDGEVVTAIYNIVNPMVVFDTPATIFDTTIDVQLSATPDDATIYYTLDENDPTTSSTVYTSAIHLEATSTIKAIAVVNGVIGAVASATYTKSEAAVEKSTWIRIASIDELNNACTNEYPIIFTNHEVTGGENAKKAMSATPKTNNRDAINISAPLQNNAKELTLTDSEENAVGQLKVLYTEGKGYQWFDLKNEGYLQGVMGDKNYLRCYKEDDPSFKRDYTYTSVSFNPNDDGKDVTVKFSHEDITKNIIKFNENSNLFSAYATGQQSISLYYKGNVTVVDLYEIFDNDDDVNIIEAKNNVTVNLYRSLTAGVWNAICLPFDMTEEQAKVLFGEGYKLEQFGGVEEENGNISLNFSTASEFKAGMPYIVMPTQSVAKKAVVVISGVNIDDDDPQIVEPLSGYTFQGFYNPTLLPAGDKQYIFIGANNQFSYPNADSSKNKSLRAFRCYFHLPQPLSADALSLSVDNQGIIDSISLIEVEGLGSNVTNNRVYSISGQCVGNSTENLPKGIYIINGRKFIVK